MLEEPTYACCTTALKCRIKFTSFSLISRWTWVSRESSPTRLAWLSTGSLVSGGAGRTRWTWIVAGISGGNLVEHHVYSAHLTCKRTSAEFNFHWPTTSLKTQGGVSGGELTVHELLTNLSRNGTHHVLGRSITLRNTKKHFPSFDFSLMSHVVKKIGHFNRIWHTPALLSLL